jgi:hypothetical protein
MPGVIAEGLPVEIEQRHDTILEQVILVSLEPQVVLNDLGSVEQPVFIRRVSKQSHFVLPGRVSVLDPGVVLGTDVRGVLRVDVLDELGFDCHRVPRCPEHDVQVRGRIEGRVGDRELDLKPQTIEA